MADKRHPRRTRRGNLVGEPISIRRGAIRGNPFPRPAVSGLPLNSVISPGCVARSINFFVPVARVPVHVHSSVVRCRCTPPRPHKLTPFLFIFQWLARNPPSPLQPPLSLFSCFVLFQQGGTTTPTPRGGVYRRRNRPGNTAITLSKRMFHGLSGWPPPLLSTFWLLRVVPFVWSGCFCSRSSFQRETRCGNKGWCAFVFSCQLSRVNRCFDSRGGF